MSQNQCDGCMAGLPLIGGMHCDENGYPVMVCQRGKYNQGEKKYHGKGLLQILVDSFRKK